MNALNKHSNLWPSYTFMIDKVIDLVKLAWDCAS
jgi:hypothetical protein